MENWELRKKVDELSKGITLEEYMANEQALVMALGRREDLLNEAIELIRLAKVEMQSWCNRTGLDADDVHEWFLLEEKFSEKLKG